MRLAVADSLTFASLGSSVLASSHPAVRAPYEAALAGWRHRIVLPSIMAKRTLAIISTRTYGKGLFRLAMTGARLRLLLTVLARHA